MEASGTGSRWQKVSDWRADGVRRAAVLQNGASAATLVGVCWQCRELVASSA